MNRAIPGIAVARVENGRVTNDEIRDSEQVFQAASLAKCITAWAVFVLIEAGLASLDAPVNSLLRSFRLASTRFNAEEVTLRRILSHTAGLSLADYPGIDPQRPLPPLAQALAAAPLEIVRAPGTGFLYSGGGYGLLQLLIEDLSRESFADHVRRSVLVPLGMTSSDFDQHSPLLERAAIGHDARDAPLPFYRFEAAAAAGLFTVAGDLARFLAANMEGPAGEAPGRGLLRPESVREMLTLHADTGRVDGLWPGYGLGWELEGTLFGHHGMNRGWRALMAGDARTRRGIVLLANSDEAMPALEARVAQWANE
jgi:CubicO group peptidase (beta-lactamase class C family)